MLSAGSSAQSKTVMGQFCITALIALALVLLVNLPSIESAPQRQPRPQVEAEAQPGLDIIQNFKVVYMELHRFISEY